MLEVGDKGGANGICFNVLNKRQRFHSNDGVALLPRTPRGIVGSVVLY